MIQKTLKVFKCLFVVAFGLLFHFIAVAQSEAWAIEDLKKLTYNQDFENLEKVLKINGYAITNANFNYNSGSYYVIAEIKCKKSLGTLQSKYGSYLDIENFEEIEISFYEKEEYKELSISQSYIDNNSIISQSPIFQYYHWWQYLSKWTYVSLGEADLYRFGVQNSQNIHGYALGQRGSYEGFSIDFEQVYPDSIKLRTYEKRSRSLPAYKKLHFRNYNPKFGTMRDYNCELGYIYTKDKHNLMSDTAYRFSLTIKDYFPKFVSSLADSKKEISLIKSGKIFHINISVGGIKKKIYSGFRCI